MPVFAQRAEQAEARIAHGEAESKAAAARAAELERALAEAEAEQARLRHELDDVLRSTFWQITGPVRRIASVLPPGLRRQGRRSARLAYWILTPHRTGERIAYFRARREARQALPPAMMDPPPEDEPAFAEARSLDRFFDADWYVERYGDVDATGLTPFEHFLIHGTQNLRDPNPAFDTAWYFEAYADVKHECIALEHFVHRGAEEGRRPFRDFDFDFYRDQARIASSSNLESYYHYLRRGRAMGVPTCLAPVLVNPRSDLNADNSTPITKEHSGNEVLAHFRERGRENGIGTIWGLAADAEIHCLKAPSFDNEVALFVTYSRNNELKPHVLHYVQSLRREGISVVLIINAERPLEVSSAELLSQVDGLFVRQNEGYDFAAWAHVLQLHRGLCEANILYLINDSLIGPIDQSEFSDIINKIRESKADVIGLTENLEKCWHLQSYFLALKQRALLSAAFDEFMQVDRLFRRQAGRRPRIRTSSCQYPQSRRA